MQDDKLKDTLELFKNLLTNNSNISNDLHKSILQKIEEIKNNLNTYDKEKVVELSESIEKLIKSKEFKQKKDFIIFEEFKNYLEKNK